MRTLTNYQDNGFGFPVVIDQVAFEESCGEEGLFINLNRLEDIVVRALPDRRIRLTGSEVRFIRLHFQMRLAEFGKHLGVSHVAVKKWEQKGSQPTGMQWAAEKNLRLFVLRRLGCSNDDLAGLFDRLELARPPGHEALRISIAPINSDESRPHRMRIHLAESAVRP